MLSFLRSSCLSRSSYQCGLRHYSTIHTSVKSSSVRYNADHGKSRKAGFLSFAAISILPVLSYYLYFARSKEEAWLNPRNFIRYVLECKHHISPTSAIFTFDNRNRISEDPNGEIWKKGIWSVEFKQPQLQIARSYTPLPPSLPQLQTTPNRMKTDCLRFLIRYYGYGEVSNYLKKLASQEPLDIRGPHLEYELPSDIAEILFLAAGTGIAPALQTIHTLFEARQAPTSALPKVHIAWANRTRQDCVGGVSDRTQSREWSWGKRAQPVVPDDLSRPQNPLVQWIARMRKEYPNHISVDYFVDDEHTFIDENALRYSLRSIHSHERQVKKLILISGPDGFTKYLAGPKEWQNGQETQGYLGGLLGKLNTRGWDVWKL